MNIVRRLWRWWMTRDNELSSEWWSHVHKVESTRGWDGPVWRTPKERALMQRQERRRAIRRVASTQYAGGSVPVCDGIE